MYRPSSQVSVFGWYILGLAALCAAIYLMADEWQIATALILLGIFAMYRAVFGQMDIDAHVREEHQLLQAEIADPNLRLLRAIAQLTPYQVDLIKSNAIQVNLTPTAAGLDRAYKLPGAMPGKDIITHETLMKFLDLSTPQYCAPLRQFSDGTERDEAHNLLDWLVYQGHISRPSSSHFPAAWQPGAYAMVCHQFDFQWSSEALCSSTQTH